jgi:uncharacterized protein (TIGR00251 family)
LTKNSLADLAVSGRFLTVRVTPNARSNKVIVENGTIRIGVTVPPADGAANAAVIKLLSKALGVPKSRLTLIKGHKSRDKVIQVD